MKGSTWRMVAFKESPKRQNAPSAPALATATSTRPSIPTVAWESSLCRRASDRITKPTMAQYPAIMSPKFALETSLRMLSKELEVDTSILTLGAKDTSAFHFCTDDTSADFHASNTTAASSVLKSFRHATTLAGTS